MKQYVSRRRRCWTLLTQIDPPKHHSEGHRSDMLLDLIGLSHEERLSVTNAILTDLPKPSSYNIHVFTSERVSKGKDGFKRVDTTNARCFRGKGKGKHTGSGQSGASAHQANLTSVEDYDYYDEDG